MVQILYLTLGHEFNSQATSKTKVDSHANPNWFGCHSKSWDLLLPYREVAVGVDESICSVHVERFVENAEWWNVAVRLLYHIITITRHNGKKGKGSHILCKSRKGVTGFTPATLFQANFVTVALLLSVNALPSQLIFGRRWAAWLDDLCPGGDLNPRTRDRLQCEAECWSDWVTKHKCKNNLTSDLDQLPAVNGTRCVCRKKVASSVYHLRWIEFSTGKSPFFTQKRINTYTYWEWGREGSDGGEMGTAVIVLAGWESINKPKRSLPLF